MSACPMPCGMCNGAVSPNVKSLIVNIRFDERMSEREVAQAWVCLKKVGLGVLGSTLLKVVQLSPTTVR